MTGSPFKNVCTCHKSVVCDRCVVAPEARGPFSCFKFSSSKMVFFTLIFLVSHHVNFFIQNPRTIFFHVYLIWIFIGHVCMQFLLRFIFVAFVIPASLSAFLWSIDHDHNVIGSLQIEFLFFFFWYFLLLHYLCLFNLGPCCQTCKIHHVHLLVSSGHSFAKCQYLLQLKHFPDNWLIVLLIPFSV